MEEILKEIANGNVRSVLKLQHQLCLLGDFERAKKVSDAMDDYAGFYLCHLVLLHVMKVCPCCACTEYKSVESGAWIEKRCKACDAFLDLEN